MTKVIATYIAMNGTSLTADSVAPAKNSRTISICAMWCA
jgi:hypothetical protein